MLNKFLLLLMILAVVATFITSSSANIINQPIANLSANDETIFSIALANENVNESITALCVNTNQPISATNAVQAVINFINNQVLAYRYSLVSQQVNATPISAAPVNGT